MYRDGPLLIAYMLQRLHMEPIAGTFELFLEPLRGTVSAEPLSVDVEWKWNLVLLELQHDDGRDTEHEADGIQRIKLRASRSSIDCEAVAACNRFTKKLLHALRGAGAL